MRLAKGAIGALAVSAMLLLTACTGGWFTPQLQGSLILGPVAWTKVVISVTEIVDGGLASIEIQTDPGFYTGMRNLSVVGENGFEVISSSFDDVNGVLKFVAVRTIGGLAGGPVATVHFTRDGSPAYDHTKLGAVVLGSDQNTYIKHYDVVSDKAYYTKEVDAQ